MRVTTAIVMAAILAAAACETFTEIVGPIPYTAELTGNAVRPTPITTNATGSVTASLDQETLQWSYTVAWNGLSGAPTGVHLHGPAAAAETGELLAELDSEIENPGATAAASGVLDLRVPITPTVSGDSLRALLNAGQAYVDIHTANNVGGEIRGQLIRH